METEKSIPFSSFNVNSASICTHAILHPFFTNLHDVESWNVLINDLIIHLSVGASQLQLQIRSENKNWYVHRHWLTRIVIMYSVLAVFAYRSSIKMLSTNKFAYRKIYVSRPGNSEMLSSERDRLTASRNYQTSSKFNYRVIRLLSSHHRLIYSNYIIIVCFGLVIIPLLLSNPLRLKLRFEQLAKWKFYCA